MAKYYMRVITNKYDSSTEAQIQHSIRTLLIDAGIRDINFHTFVPYWKTEGQGELACQFSATIPLEKVLYLFADQWKANTANSQWSDIHLPSTSFLWISD